jgi:isochorismate synthase
MGISFAIYREASDNKIFLCTGSFEKSKGNLEFENLPNGFILSPWAKSNELWCILGDMENISEMKVLDFLRDFEFHIDETQTLSTTYSEFENEVLTIQKEIEIKNLEKAVASRVVAEAETFNIEKIATWFQLLLENHRNSFVSLVYTSDFGLWIGATPETLISYENNFVQTMSLAGTLVNENDQWSAKESLEQSVTSKFILETLNNLAAGPIEPTSIDESTSGSLRHLKSGFKTEIKTTDLMKLVTSISPTPAVGGYPQKEAMEWLLENELHNRELFTGFIGPKNTDKLLLLVNLRCAKITKNQHIYFAGCGVNSGSEVKKEWFETEAKMNVIRSFWN